MAGSEENAGSSSSNSSKTRCYWAVLDTSMTFQYLDPLLQEHMREQASTMLGKSLVDFIHPEEQPVAENDFAKFKTHTSVFGSVTRCRYAQVSQSRRILGAEDVKDGVAVNGSDDKWVATKITSSLIALNAVLAFFHSMPDGEGEPDEANNCGPAVADASKDYMTPTQVELLQKALSKCQSEATDDMRQNVAAVKQAQHMGPNGTSPPLYTFQLLDTNTDAVYFSWPPSKPTGDDDDRNTHGTAPEGEERYSPQEYAALAKSVSLPQPPAGDTTETNCTRRYQSKHPVLFDNSYVNVESVVITYRSLTIVCFQSGGIFLNRNIFAAVAPPLPADDGKRKHDSFSDLSEHEAIKRLRTANLQLDDQNTPVPSNLDLSHWQNNDPNNQSGQFGNMGNNTQVPQSWGNDDPNNLQSPYYNAGGSYPNVYSNMFSNDGRNGGFMGGSTTIPPMPTPSQPTNSNGLNNLALASSSNYYSDFNPNNFNVDGSANPQNAGNDGSGNESPAIDGPNTDDKGVVIHRVRKNDRGRMCTSCGTTNSPEWRKGPSGIKTLCNACGLRYSRAQARKAKKAAKEAEAAAGGGNYSSNGNNMSQDNISTSYNIPTPLQIPNSASTVPGGPGSAGTPHSPYLPIGDYSVHSALPPLPQSTHDDGSGQSHAAGTNGSGQNNDQNSFGSYGNFVNFNFAGQWGNASPTGNQSFAQQQGQ